jgi:hypothetical protein
VGGQQGFFYPAPATAGAGGKRSSSGGRAVGFERIYDALISAGYGRTPREIGRYTWRQMQLFFAARQAAERRARRHRLIDNSAAFAGGQAAKDLHRTLED